MAAIAAVLLVRAARAVRCDRVAAPRGSDRARGDSENPFRTAGRLAHALAAGETGCLRAGVYTGDLRIARGGRAGAPIALRSFPGDQASVAGRLWLARGGDHVVVSDLRLDGANRDRLPSPTVNAADVTFARDDVSNRHTGICFLLGSDRFGRARAVRIVDSRIHDCGRLPPTNHDHGIYVQAADGTDIERDWIYANADRGIQLFPDAQRTRIAHDVVEGNGEGIIFSGAGRVRASDTIVVDSVISGSRIRSDLESFYPPGTPPGVRNVVSTSCVGTIDTSGGGFELRAVVRTRPRYADAPHGDLRLRSAGACARMLAP